MGIRGHFFWKNLFYQILPSRSPPEPWWALLKPVECTLPMGGSDQHVTFSLVFSLVFLLCFTCILRYFCCISVVFLLCFAFISFVFILYFFCISFVILLYFFCISFVFLLYFSGQTGWGEWNANAIGPTLDNVKPPPTEPSTIEGGKESAETKLNKMESRIWKGARRIWKLFDF